MSFGVVRDMLGWCSRWRGKTLGRRGARRQEDQGVWLHRNCRSEAVDSSCLPGTGAGRGINRYPTVEWCLRKVFKKSALKSLEDPKLTPALRLCCGVFMEHGRAIHQVEHAD